MKEVVTSIVSRAADAVRWKLIPREFVESIWGALGEQAVEVARIQRRLERLEAIAGELYLGGVDHQEVRTDER